MNPKNNVAQTNNTSSQQCNSCSRRRRYNSWFSDSDRAHNLRKSAKPKNTYAQPRAHTVSYQLKKHTQLHKGILSYTCSTYIINYTNKHRYTLYTINTQVKIVSKKNVEILEKCHKSENREISAQEKNAKVSLRH